MANTEKYDVFLSFAAKDSNYARAISKELARRGLHVWEAKSEIPAGEPWAKKLEAALLSASSCVVLISEEALDSPWVNFELGAAFGRSKKVVPVYLSRGARRHARSLFSSLAGIVAEDMSPKDVAAKVADAMGA